jgi:hypothetical protein
MHRDSELLSMAAQQGGVVTRLQAFEVGYSRSAIERRVSDARWERIANGGYRLIPSRGEEDLVRAAVAVLPGAVVSHGSAARLIDIEVGSEFGPTVLVHSKTTHTFPSVTVVRCHDLLDRHVLHREALRLTSPARTVVDLAAVLPMGRLSRVIDDMVSNRLCSVDDIDEVLAEVARRGKPGVVAHRMGSGVPVSMGWA